MKSAEENAQINAEQDVGDVGLKKHTEPVEDELAPEYRLDYRKAKQNRFAPTRQEGDMVMILEPDIAQVFRTPESVTKVLRALIENMPRPLRP